MAVETLSVEQYLAIVGTPGKGKGRGAKQPPEPAQEAGSVICEATIPGRPVPWKAPRVNRKGGCYPTRDYKRYLAWQGRVHDEARALMRRNRPYGGPVEMTVTYYLSPRPGVPGDLDNLDKALNDALQGAVFRNDRQVHRKISERVISATERERVEIKVCAYDRREP